MTLNQRALLVLNATRNYLRGADTPAASGLCAQVEELLDEFAAAEPEPRKCPACPHAQHLPGLCKSWHLSLRGEGVTQCPCEQEEA